jgi:hypothetical protein
MNHRTPAEQFRAALAALTREQLEEAMRYLRIRDEDAMDAALSFVTTPAAAPEPISGVTPPREVQMAEFAEIIGGRNQYEQPEHDHDDAGDPWTSGAHEFIHCTTCSADACNACSRPARDDVHRIAGDFGPQQVDR